MTNNFLRGMVEKLKDDDLSIMHDGQAASEFSTYMDTGSYVLNALFSADLFGGIADNKAIAFAGESSAGKSFFVMAIMKNFLAENPEAIAIYYDTESAVTKEMMEKRGIDTTRVLIGEPATVEQFRHKALTFLSHYIETPDKQKPKCLMILDSLGMLSTTKEVNDTAEGKDTKDMTRAGIVRATFRTIRLKLAKAKVPLLVTNHTYAAIGSMYPTQEMSGGGGLKFAADQIAMISKRKEKVGDEVIGNVVHVKLYKSRITKENKMVDVLITYEGGLSKYYGLLDMAERYGVFKKVSTRFELPDGSKHFGSAIYKDPERFFTREVLEKINEGVKKEFSYGSSYDSTREEVESVVADDAGEE